MLSLQQFVFGDGQLTPVSFTVVALDPTNDVLFAKAAIEHEYSFADAQSQYALLLFIPTKNHNILCRYVAGFFYENRPSDIENDANTEVRILSNVKAAAFHMTAQPDDLNPGSQRFSQEMTKRANSPKLSSALPLNFDIPENRDHTFSFPASVRAHFTQPLSSFVYPPPPYLPSLTTGRSHIVQKLDFFVLQYPSVDLVCWRISAAWNDNRRYKWLRNYPPPAGISPRWKISCLHHRHQFFCIHNHGTHFPSLRHSACSLKF